MPTGGFFSEPSELPVGYALPPEFRKTGAPLGSLSPRWGISQNPG